MKHVLTLALVVAFAPQAHAFDPELARLQNAEAAIRAGATRTPPSTARTPSRQTQSETPTSAATTPAKPADGFFPLPARTGAPPRSGGVQALIAARATQPSPKADAPETASAADPAIAEGLAAFEDARRSRGLR